MRHDAETAPEVGRRERELAERLRDERPLPRAGFRGELGRRLAARDPGYGPRPPHLRLTVVAYLGAGWALIALGAASAVGAL